MLECGESEREIHISHTNYIHVESEKSGRDDLNYKAGIETQEEKKGADSKRGRGAGRAREAEMDAHCGSV